ncbi:Uncharacterised protein [Legionella pneumophila]|nr:Uncharacterised protein [Legionella pneumophila]CZH34512.1 Uncharacterised protein [Legionella pneumophila]CZH80136.1 Uncharacterised protein [Legionella pneumophila]CZJ68364.1 Uncharacterised protein [Legionella pneumophila]CZJ73150.1 Uncharacterised protein [Legionella pneumophila]
MRNIAIWTSKAINLTEKNFDSIYEDLNYHFFIGARHDNNEWSNSNNQRSCINS